MLDTAPHAVVRGNTTAPASRPATPAGSGARDSYYDGIRAIAVATVLAYHWMAQYLPVFHGGYVGVDVFFVLSGFVITSVLWHRDRRPRLGAAYRAFLTARVRRLYPALLAVLAIGTAVVALTKVPVSGAAAVKAASLALVQATSYVQAVSPYDAVPFAHTWTLSVEWSFYLLWPLVLLRARRAGVSPQRLALGALWAALVLYALDLLASPRWFYFALSARAPQLLAGCAVALWAASGRGRPRLPGRTVDALAALSVAVIVFWTVAGRPLISADYRVIGFPLITLSAVLLCAVPFLSSGSVVEKAIGWRPMALVGMASYSLYLWHLVAVETLDPKVVPLPMAGIEALLVVVTVGATWLSYRFLERPFLRARTGSLRAPAAAPEAARSEEQ